jgi:hypothetical protein
VAEGYIEAGFLNSAVWECPLPLWYVLLRFHGFVALFFEPVGNLVSDPVVASVYAPTIASERVQPS